MFEILGGIIVFSIMLLLSGIKVVNEYDRLVVFRFGKAIEVKGTGVQLVIPLIDRVQIVDMRLVTMPVEFVEEDTLDNQTVRVSALCLFRVADPKKMVTKIDDAHKATREIVKTTLRTCIRQYRLSSLMADRRRVNFTLNHMLTKQTKEWGVQIHSIEINEVKMTREAKRLLSRGGQHHDHVPQLANQLQPPPLPSLIQN